MKGSTPPSPPRPVAGSGLEALESVTREVGSFTVRRVLPHPRRRMVGPFIFVDHMTPRRVDAGDELTVRGHPHIGLATVTYLFEGELWHRDSLGFEQAIRPGAINWMTAGRGIAHSERTHTPAGTAGAVIEGVQIWIALPVEHEEVEPDFVHYPADAIPEWTAAGSHVRLLIGSALGRRSPVATLSPVFYLACRIEPGGGLRLPVAADEEGAVYVVSGGVTVDDRRFEPGSLVCLPKGAPITVAAAPAAGPARVMILGGRPFPEPRHIWWNFVSSSTDRIRAAARQWAEGRFPPVRNESESIPLPDDPLPR